MAKLYFSLDGNSLGEFGLDKERTTIGRRPTNDIHIDNLAVSGEHATITTIGNDSFLEDLNSTNGTLVNSKPIKKHVLQHGDVIEFGKYQLKYENKAQEKSLENRNGFENTVLVRPAKLDVSTPDVKAEVEKKSEEPLSDSVTPEDIAQAPTEAILSAAKVGHLQVLNGTDSGQVIVLNKALTTLGKPGVQVAVVTKRPHGYFVAHVEGETMPLVNGQKIGAQALELNDHDVIDLAGIKMEFYLV